MIEECPINMECRLIDTIDMPNHDVFIGEITETDYDEECLSGDAKNPDFAKVEPILFVSRDPSYCRLGERFSLAYNVGKELLNR